MKRRWLLVTIIAGILALGITAGAVLAKGNGDGDSAAKSFAGRVAAILGLEEAQVKDAFTQAANEAWEDRLNSKLDRMVEQGRITQDQADEYQEWFQSKPDGFDFGHRFRRHGGRSFSGDRSFGRQGLRGIEQFNRSSREATPLSVY